MGTQGTAQIIQEGEAIGKISLRLLINTLDNRTPQISSSSSMQQLQAFRLKDS